MLFIGKTAQNAIAVTSYLAECYYSKSGAVSSIQVAEARGISKSLSAKILTTLSKTPFLKGTTGPGGGYQLVRDPATICLMDVVVFFELQNKELLCPFGKGWCGEKEPCPLHDQIVSIQEKNERFLKKNHFGIFAN